MKISDKSIIRNEVSDTKILMIKQIDKPGKLIDLFFPQPRRQ